VSDEERSARGWARSPSQITQFEKCPKAFEYQYLKKYNLANAWQIRGRANHKALEHNFRQKIETGVDLRVDDCLEVFHAEVRQAFSPMAREEIVLFEGQSEDRIRKEGEAALRVYFTEIAPTIQPLMVEEPMEMTLPSGLRLRGKLDLVDDHMRIRDAKFPTDKMHGDTLHYQDQPPIYGALFHARVGRYPEFVFDVVRSGRAKEPLPQAQPPLSLQVTEALVRARLVDVELVDAQINAGFYPRRPSEQNCNKCVFKHACWWTVLPPKAEAPALAPALAADGTPGEQGDLVPALQASLEQTKARKVTGRNGK
jgi:hypothetical protein